VRTLPLFQEFRRPAAVGLGNPRLGAVAEVVDPCSSDDGEGDRLDAPKSRGGNAQKPVREACVGELPVANAGEDFPEGGMPGTEDPDEAVVVHGTPAAGGAVTEATVPQLVCGGCRPGCKSGRVDAGPGGGGGDGVTAAVTRLPMPAGGVGDDTLVVPLAEDPVRPHAPPLLAVDVVEEPGALPALTGALLPPGLAAICDSAVAAATAAVLPVVLELKGKTLAVALLQFTA